MVFILFEQLRIGKDSLSYMCQGVNNTEHGSWVVMSVPLQVQICVCMSFLYTVVMRDLPGCDITKVARNGMDLSALVSSIVNWMCGYKLLMSSRNFSLYDVSMITKVSSTYLFNNLGGYSAVLTALISKSSI